MRKRLLSSFFILFFLSSLSVLAKKSYRFDRYDVSLTVQEDGSFRVEEILSYRFTGGTFTYAYRDIRTAELSYISDVSVEGLDVELTEVKQEEKRNSYRVRWEFPPHTGVATFRISYTAHGALGTFEGMHYIYWRAIGKQIEVPVEAFSVRVYLPFQNLAPKAINAYLEEAEIRQSESGTEITFTYKDLKPKAGYLVKVDFPQCLDLPETQNYSAEAEAFRQKLIWLLFLVPTGFVGGIWILVSGPRVRSREITSPSRPEIPIAEAGFLLFDDDMTRMRIFPALLFDLAKRGYLRLWQDTPPDKKKPVIRVDIKNFTEGLNPTEKNFLNKLSEHEDVKTFFRKSQKYRSAELPKLRKRILESGHSKSLASRANILLLIGLLVLTVFFVIITLLNGQLAGIIGGVCGAVALLFLLGGLKRYQLTEKGAQEKAEIRAYVRDLYKRLEKERENDPVRAAVTLLEFLPWLMYSFKFNEAWLGKLKKQLKNSPGKVELPDWLVLQQGDEESEEGMVSALIVTSFVNTHVVSSSGAVAGVGVAGAGAVGAGAAGGGGAGAG